MVDLYVPMIVGGALGLAVASAYSREFVRRSNFKKYVERFILAESENQEVRPDEQLGDLGLLVRVYWDEEINGYKNQKNQSLDLSPLKTIPLNFHWSWWGETLLKGLGSHIQEEGIKLGADAYFLSHMVSGHGNPMYALTYYKIEKQI